MSPVITLRVRTVAGGALLLVLAVAALLWTVLAGQATAYRVPHREHVSVLELELPAYPEGGTDAAMITEPAPAPAGHEWTR